MYKGMAKRVLAGVLALCMAGSLPDYTVLAAGMGGDYADKMEAVNETESAPSFSAVRKAERAATADIVSLTSNAVHKPGASEILTQIRDQIPTVAGSFVSSEVLGLDLYVNYGEANEVKLKQRLQETASDGDYTVTTGAVTQDTAVLYVDGVNNYNGRLEYTVKLGRNIADASITVETDWEGQKNATSYPYEGRKITPSVTLKDGTKSMAEGTDFTVEQKENTNVKDPSGIVITGTGEYAGIREVSFAITAVPVGNLYQLALKSTEVSYDKGAANTTEGIAPAFTVANIKMNNEIVYDSESTEEAPQDFEFSYNGNKGQTGGALTASIKLVAGTSGNCTGESNPQSFKIAQADISEANAEISAEIPGDFIYTGTPIHPDTVNVTQNGVALDGNDFEILSDGYGANLIGEGTVKIKGKGNYVGERTVKFQIAKFDFSTIADADIKDIPDQAYTGNAVEISDLGNTLTANGHTFVRDTDYVVSYEDNVRAGTAKVIFTAKAGSNCTGRKEKTFTIYKNIDHDDIEITFAEQTYTGSRIEALPVIRDTGKPSVRTLEKDTHYTVEYDGADDYTEMGAHEVTIKGDGVFYRGEAKAEFTIAQRDMADVIVAFKNPGTSHVFTGTAIRPEVVIYGTMADGSRVELPKSDFIITYTEKDGDDAADCINVGAYQVKVERDPSNQNYKGGAKRLDYAITSKKLLLDAKQYTITLSGYEFPYTGSPIEPDVTIQDLGRKEELKEGTDFTLSYSDNTEVGDAEVAITGINNYDGVVTRTFKITKKDLGTATNVVITLKAGEEYVYTGDPIEPIVEKLEIDGEEWDEVRFYQDFIVKSEAVDVGTGYTFTIEGKSNYKGSISSQTVTFDIKPKNIEDELNVRIEDIPNQAYTGSPIEPVPVITYNGKTLVQGKDFTTAYANNTDKHLSTDTTPAPTITITGDGNFTGTRTVTFDICESIVGAIVEGLDGYECSYTSRECRPKPTGVKLADGTALWEGIDYKITYEDNINANVSITGAPLPDRQTKVVINGYGEYGGKIEKAFTIKPVNMGKGAFGNMQLDTALFQATVGSSPSFTGSAVRPTLLITYRPNATDPDTGEKIEYHLESEKDFDFQPVDNVNVGNGQYWLSIRPKGNFMCSDWVKIRQYTIRAKDISSAEIEVRGLENIDTTQRPVKIDALSLVDTKRGADGAYVPESGVYQLVPGTGATGGDYTISASGLGRPGTAKVRMTGRGNYGGSREVTFEIKGTLADADVIFQDSTVGDKASGRYYFTGSPIQPRISVICGKDENNNDIVLRNGSDFEYTVEGDAINRGAPQIVLTGKGAYAGTEKRVSFTIEPRALSDNSIRKNIPQSVDWVDDVTDVWPIPTLMLGKYELKEGVDYRLVPETECRVPTMALNPPRKYLLEIKAIEGGNFTGGVTATYTIGVKLNLRIVFEDSGEETYETTYTGRPIEPKVKVYDNDDGVWLTEEQFSVSYSDNINAGIVTVTVSGNGDPAQAGSGVKQYYGTATTKFTIKPKDLGGNDIVIAPIPDITYTASPIKPEPEVTWTGNAEDGTDRILVPGEDFQFEYQDTTNAGVNTAKVIVKPKTGDKNFTGSKQQTFTILQKSLLDADVVAEGIPDQVYIGAAIEPELNIHWGADSYTQVTLKAADYEVTNYVENNTDVGAVEMTVKGVGNYKDEITMSFHIVKVNLNNVNVEYSKEEQYTGRQIRPEVTMKYRSTDGKTEVTMSPEKWGYSVTYGSNEMIGTRQGKITVEADPDGNCEGGPLELTFDIVPRDLNDTEHVLIEPEQIPDQYINPAVDGECRPEIKITFIIDGYQYVLQPGTDYRITYSGNKDYNPAAEVKLEGLGNFGGTVIKKFKILKKLTDYIDASAVVVEDAALVYNGQKNTPVVNLNNAFINGILTEGTDYRIVWDGDCINAGTYTGKIEGTGTYGGEIPLQFSIKQRNIGRASFTIEDQVYIGGEITPVITAEDKEINVSLGNSDFKVINTEGSLIEPGEVTVTIEAANPNYQGTATTTFEILRADITADYMESVTMIAPQAYTGEAITPETPIQDTRRNQDGGVMTGADAEMYTLEEGVDYTVAITDNKYPGKATVTITGIGHYDGTLIRMFDILADLSLATIDPIPAQAYTGEEVRPTLNVTLGEKNLTEGKDYRVAYADNIERGTAKATIYPADISMYTGEQTVTFGISRDIAGAQILLVDSAFTYTGNEIAPAAAVIFDGETLVEDRDYKIRYANNIEVGTANIYIEGVGGYDGTGGRTFEIIKRSVVRCEYENVVDKTYVGAPTYQELVVTDGGRRLTENLDYTVRYVDNAAPGIATIEISGAGNYGGVKTIRYLVNFTDISAVSAEGLADAVQIDWTAVPGAQGYAIYDGNNQPLARTTALSYKDAGLDALTTYTYKIRPYAVSNGTTYYGNFSGTIQATTSIAKPVVKLKAKKKQIKISWKRISGVSGYEIYRSDKKKRGYKKVRTAGKAAITSYTNKRLTRKKKYFYKVRAYKTVNGKKVYSSYSSPKSVKTK